MLLSSAPRWSVLRCGRIRKLCISGSVLILTASLGLLVYIQFYLRCSEGASIQQIEKLCSLYYDRKIVGTMCSSLCDEGNFRRTQCDGNRWGKKVQIMTCDGCDAPGMKSTVVMKAQFDMEVWDTGVNVRFNESMPTEQKIDIATVEIRKHSTRFFDTPFTGHPDLISHFLGTDYKNFLNKINGAYSIDYVLKSAISLAVQWEYLSMKVLGNQRFLPKLYGTCGQAYFVEYTPSLGKYNYVLFQSKAPDMLYAKQYNPSWKERVNIALKILKLIKDIENIYPRPLHMCDIQTHNFGLNKDGDIVLLDSDSVRFESVIPVHNNCTTEGCNYLTCHGTCGEDSRCAREMITSNLQTVCKAVFISKVESLGLLRGPPASIEKELRSLLQECAYPEKGIFRIPIKNKSDRLMMKKLENVLEKSLH